MSSEWWCLLKRYWFVTRWEHLSPDLFQGLNINHGTSFLEKSPWSLASLICKTPNLYISKMFKFGKVTLNLQTNLTSMKTLYLPRCFIFLEKQQWLLDDWYMLWSIGPIMTFNPETECESYWSATRLQWKQLNLPWCLIFSKATLVFDHLIHFRVWWTYHNVQSWDRMWEISTGNSTSTKALNLWWFSSFRKVTTVIGQLIWFMVDWIYQDVQKLSDFGSSMQRRTKMFNAEVSFHFRHTWTSSLRKLERTTL